MALGMEMMAERVDDLHLHIHAPLPTKPDEHVYLCSHE